MNIGDIFFSLRGTGDQLQVDAQKAASAAGLKAGGSFSSTFGAKARAGIGMAVGAAFGIAAAGAVKLDTAMRSLQAETGMTDAEAKKAAQSIATIYSHNLQGMDQIGAAMAKVHNDLGLTGDAADAMTAKFMKLATATGQDAAEAVSSFDDILDAWGLTAEDAGEVMDKLVASHQKYGGSIVENQKALGTLAPQLKALGVDIDGAIGLLNLFEASGLDSAKATFALNTAVKNLKPGENLDDLIAQVTAIEDPTQRAQKAIELFGARGGVSLANALRPGMTGLRDFEIGTTEVAGATERAADAMESSWGNRFTLLMHQAGAALAGFGQNFGPLLMVAAQLGPKMVTTIASGLGGLAAAILPRIIGAFTYLPTVAAAEAAGAGIGTAASGGIAGGIAKGAGLVRAAVAALFSPAGLAIAIPVVLTVVVAEIMKGEEAKSLAAKTTKELQDYRDEVQAKLDAARGDFFFDLFGPKHEIEHALEAVNAELALRGQDTGAAFGESLVSGILKTGNTVADALKRTFAAAAGSAEKTAIRKPFETLTSDALRTAAILAADKAGKAGMQSFGESLLKAAKLVLPVAAEDVIAVFGLGIGNIRKAALRTGAEGMLALAAGITGARAKPLDAFDTLVEMLKHQMSRTQETARLAGELTSKELAKGLRSRDPAVRAQAEATKKLIIDRLAELATGATGLGSKAMAELKVGMKSKDPEIRKASTAAYDAAMSKLKDLPVATGATGTAAGAALAAGLSAKIIPAIDAMIAQVNRLFRAAGQRPIPTGGKRAAGAATGMAFVAADMPVYVHRGEAILTVAEAEERRAGRASTGGTGGNTYNVNVTGLIRARDPLEIATQLRRLAEFGVLTPKRTPA